MNVNDKIQDLLGLTHVAGDIGLEIEVEGRNLPRVNTPTWKTERDTSLKAEEAYEYVLNRPVKIERVENVLSFLRKAFEKNGSVIDNSYRAGVHVHINICELSLVQLANFVTLSICFEGILSDYCGESRKGNLFCLRVRDAEQTIDEWIKCFKKLNFRNQNALKYGFVNLATVGIYGSLEFRGMYSTTDADVLLPWVYSLYDLREYAKTFENPTEIIERFSTLGCEEFCKAGLSKLIPLLDVNLMDVWRDVRLAQDFAFGLGREIRNG